MNLQFPSVQNLASEAKTAFLRFPLVITIALIAGAAVLIQIEWEPFTQRTWWQIFYPMVLLIPMSFLVTLFNQSRLWNPVHKLIFSCLCLTALASYAVSPVFSSYRIHDFRFFQLFLGFHLLIAAAAHLRHSNLTQFWKFNENLFTQFILTTTYSAFICGGLLICLGTFHYLFGNKVHEKIYFDIFVLVSFVFHPWFFMSGVSRTEEIESDRLEYPVGIKIFTQYVLIPLVTIYMVILYLYLGKVLVLMQWPKGNVGWLVSSFSVVGMLCLLLLHPIQERTENLWVKTFGRLFYVGLLPLVVLLVLGTWKRIEAYGVTEKRYFLMALGIWITAMSVGFGILRKRNIKWIPITLGALCLLSSFGPWGAYDVSFRSQWNRLHALLGEYHLLENGKIQKTTEAVPLNARIQMSSVLDYINSMHGTRKLQPYFNQSFANEIHEQRYASYYGSPEISRKMMEEMGLKYASPWERESGAELINWYHNYGQPNVVHVTGFDYVFPFNLGGRSKDYPTTTKLDDKTIVSYVTDDLELIIKYGTTSLNIPLKETIQQIKDGKTPKDERLVVEGRNGTIEVKIFIDGLNGRTDATTKVTSLSMMNGQGLIKFGK